MPGTLSDATRDTLYNGSPATLNSQQLNSYLNQRQSAISQSNRFQFFVDSSGVVLSAIPGVSAIPAALSWINDYALQNGRGNDPQINAFVSQEVARLRTVFASGQAGSFTQNNLQTFQNAIDYFTNADMPEVARLELGHFVLDQMTTSLTALQTNANQVNSRLSSLASSDATQNQLIQNLSGVTSNLSQRVQSVISSVGQLRQQTTFNTQNIQSLQSGLSSLHDTVANQALQLQDIQLVNRLIFNQLMEIDTQELENSDRQISELYDRHQQLRGNPTTSPSDLFASRQALQNAISDRIDSVNTFRDYIDGANSLAGFVEGLAPTLGIPELQNAKQITSGLIKIGLGITAMGAFGADWAASASVIIGSSGGTLAPALAIATGIATLYSAFQSSSGGGDGIGEALAQISQQIQALSQQIQRLGEHIDNRFDRLETFMEQLFFENRRLIMRSFTNMVSLLDEFHQDMIDGFIQTEGRLDGINVLLNDITNQLNRLTQATEAGFRQLYQQRYEDILRIVYYYQNQRYGQVPLLTERELRDTLAMLVTWGSSDAKRAILSGDNAGDYSIAALQTVPVNDLWNYVNLLLGFITSPQGYGLSRIDLPLPSNMTVPINNDVVCQFPAADNRVVNPIVWQQTVKDLLYFVFNIPELSLLPNDICFIQQLIRPWEAYLRMNLGLRTQPQLFPRLLNDYEQGFSQMLELLYAQILIALEATPQRVREQLLLMEQAANQVTSIVDTFSNQISTLRQQFIVLRDLIFNSCAIAKYFNGPRGAGLCYQGSGPYVLNGVTFYTSQPYINSNSCHDTQTYSAISQSDSPSNLFFTTLNSFRNFFDGISNVSSSYYNQTINFTNAVNQFSENNMIVLDANSNSTIQGFHLLRQELLPTQNRLSSVNLCQQFAFYSRFSDAFGPPPGGYTSTISI